MDDTLAFALRVGGTFFALFLVAWLMRIWVRRAPPENGNE